ncbi:MAG: ATPase [Anaerolineales bacterium]|nr:ATPase [Anaerolineales bacterium]
MNHFLGIDGGGTHTRAVIVDETGVVCGVGTSGPSNYDDVGIEQAQANISAAVAAAWAQTGLPAQTCTAAFLGMAGVVSPSDVRVILNIAKNLQLAPPARTGVQHDIHIALVGGLGGRPGIALIAGTGSACYGINAVGENWRAGGWGQLIGDEGSSYWLGLQAMRAAVRATDGRGKPTSLEAMVLRTLNLTAMNDIMHLLYSDGLSRSAIAALAPLVVNTAMQEDVVAKQLVVQAAKDLADSVYAVAQRLNMLDASELVLIGGLLDHAPLVREQLHAQLTRCLPTCRIVPREMPPVMGACLLAIKSVRGEIAPHVLDSLQNAPYTPSGSF